MEIRSGWLERSLDRARTQIQERPEHLKPERHRVVKEAKPKAKKAQGRQAS